MDVELNALAESQATMCSVFANPKRVLILWSLAERELSVTDIAMSINASLQCTSQHLHLMKKTGILESHREGQTVYYHIIDDRLTERCQLLQRICQGGT